MPRIGGWLLHSQTQVIKIMLIRFMRSLVSASLYSVYTSQSIIINGNNYCIGAKVDSHVQPVIVLQKPISDEKPSTRYNIMSVTIEIKCLILCWSK